MLLIYGFSFLFYSRNVDRRHTLKDQMPYWGYVAWPMNIWDKKCVSVQEIATKMYPLKWIVSSLICEFWVNNLISQLITKEKNSEVAYVICIQTNVC